MDSPGRTHQSLQQVAGTLCRGRPPLHARLGPQTLLSPLNISPVSRGGITVPQPQSCVPLPRLGGRSEFPLAQKKLTHVSRFLVYLQKGDATSNSVAKDALGTTSSSFPAALGLLCSQSSSEAQGLRHTSMIVSHQQLPSRHAGFLGHFWSGRLTPAPCNSAWEPRIRCQGSRAPQGPNKHR